MLSIILKNKKVVLASESPRRKEIFKNVGINALQMPSNIDEPNIDIRPHLLVKHHAENKAKAVASHLDDKCVIIGSDTLVFFEDKVLGKPKNKYEAYSHLRMLSGKKHSVYTGVAIIYKKQLVSFYEKTIVEFDDLSDKVIDQYIETGDCFDKAGGYGIQGISSQFIKKINGCYFNVMGFPINKFARELKKLLIEVDNENI